MTDLTAKTYRYYVDTDGYGTTSLFVEDPERPDHPVAVMREPENLRTWPVVEAVFAQPAEAVDAVAQALASRTRVMRPWDEMGESARGVYRERARTALSALRDLAGGAS